MKHRWLNLPLGSKIASLTSFLVMAAILVLTLVSIQRERDYFRRELEDQASLLLETLPLTMRDQLYRMELDELIDIAIVVGKSENIDQFVIYDQNGVILYDSSQPGLIFSQVIDPFGYALITGDPGQFHSNWEADQFIAGQPITLGNQTLGAVAVGLSTEIFDEKIEDLTWHSLILAIIRLGIGVALSFWLGRQIANPLRTLAEVACEMAASDLFVRVDLQTQKDEVGQLGQAFNQMTDSIQKREHELRDLAAGLECTVRERTEELRLQNEHLEQIAITDPLTKIYNRRYFFELARKEIARALRYQNPLSVVLLDADHFKDMNDNYGHLIGDQILINLAELCRRNIRSLDIMARFGGEEFVILMPEVDCLAAQKSAERLRKIVEETSLIAGGFDVKITISLGVACWNGDGELDFNALLARADRALYQSKEDGRNRVSA